MNVGCSLMELCIQGAVFTPLKQKNNQRKAKPLRGKSPTVFRMNVSNTAKIATNPAFRCLWCGWDFDEKSLQRGLNNKGLDEYVRESWL